MMRSPIKLSYYTCMVLELDRLKEEKYEKNKEYSLKLVKQLEELDPIE